MKKSARMLAAAMAAVMMLTACGSRSAGSTTAAPAGDSKAAETQAEAGTEAKESGAAEGEKAGADGVLKVALILPGKKDDVSFNLSLIHIYCRLGQYGTAIGYLKNAWELACRCKKYGYYRSLTRKLMETNYWLGDLKEAGAFGDLYRKRLESDYEECDDLGLSIEELMTRPNMESRQTLYNLFCWAYYTGRGDQARRYIGLMEQRDMCWWCDEDGCTEFWEARGLLAMLDGSVEEALAAFRTANRVIWLRCV